jgi:centromeric protein E
VFGSSTTTEEVYRAMAQQVIEDAMQGVNGTIFAYGQTASGKTFTMRGTDEAPGIVPLAIRQIFGRIRECADREFLLRVSYMEIYNEKARDLLACDEHTTVQVRQDPKVRTSTILPMISGN